MKNLFLCIKKSKIIAFCVCLMLIFSHFILYFQIENYKKVVDSLSYKIFNGFNHKFSEYDYGEKDSNIFFVSNIKEYISLGVKLPSLFLPTSEEYEMNDGIIKFKITKNFFIKSAGEGIVKSVGFLDNGLKYVEIRHSGNIITRYENLKIVGVGTNFMVKNIHIIGSVEENQNLIFKIIKNGNIVKNYTIENGEIKWQN